ncbi:hypothetical protein QNN00_17230 [Bacillus velezensis]|nr:hypothetical protein [Bacillus velezensis]
MALLYHQEKLESNKPLSRDEFELIGTVNHDGSKADTNLTHKIFIAD